MPLQIRRGPTADRLAITPLVGEIVYDTTTGAVFVGNGVTAGGVPVTSFSVADSKNATVELFLGLSHSDNTQHSGITFQNNNGRIQATVAQNLSNYQGLIVADQGFKGNLWADDSGIIINSETHEVTGLFIPTGDIIPDAFGPDLGSAGIPFNNVYVGGILRIGNAALTSTGTAVDLPVGSTIGGQAVGINEGDTYNITISGNVISSDSTVMVNTDTGSFRGNLVGSVFADDSSILIDGTAGVLRGTLIGNVTGNVTGDLIGTASLAAVSNTVALTATNTSASTHYIGFTLNASGNENLRTDTSLTYQPSTNTLTAGAFIGNLTGSVTGNISTTTINSADSGAITVVPAIIFNSDVTVENELFVGGDIFPDASESYNIGSFTKKFSKLYLKEGANALWIGNAAISGSGTVIDLPAGSTIGGSAITTAAGANASTITVNTTGTSADHYVSFFDAQSGTKLIYTDDTFKYNPGTGVLTVGDATIGTVTGNLVGNVTGNTTGVHTGFVDGDVRGSVFADDSSVMVNAIDRAFVGSLTGRVTASASSTVTDGGAFILGSNTVTGSLLVRNNTATNAIRNVLYSNTATDTQRLVLERYRGTVAVPLTIQSGDRIGDLRWHSTDTNNVVQVAGAIRCEADGNPTSNAVPGLMRLMTGNNSTGIVTTAITIDSDQIVTVIRDLGVNGSLTVGSSLLLDNSRISTINTNADLELQPAGTGKVDVQSNLEAIGSIKSSGTAGVGYATGAGGVVTQVGSKTNSVTLNKICGQITTTADSIGSGNSASFTLTNSTIADSDVVYVSIKSGASVAGAYTIFCDAVATGSCRISIFNLSGSPKTDTLVINYSVIKSVNS